jgi:sigma-B regulation protein RsbQ
MPFSSVLSFKKHNINIVGTGTKTMLLAHGYGCDQVMWRFLTAAFQDEYRIVLFDHVGAGKSDLSAYIREKYGSLSSYADDVLDIIESVCTGRRRWAFRQLNDWNSCRYKTARGLRAAGPR